MKVSLPPLPETPDSFKPPPPPPPLSTPLRRRRCQRHRQTGVSSSKARIKTGM